jgi:hypothetical protein
MFMMYNYMHMRIDRFVINYDIFVRKDFGLSPYSATFSNIILNFSHFQLN